MGGSHRKAVFRSGIREHSRKSRRLRIGGAGAVEPDKRHLCAPGAVAGGYALVEKVPGENEVHIRHHKPAFFKGGPSGNFLHLAFSLFPGFFAEVGILVYDVEVLSERTLALLFRAHRRRGENADAAVDNYRLFSYFMCQYITSI